MSGKVNALILLEDGSAEDGGSDLSSVCNGVHSGLGGAVCVPDSFSIMCIGVRSGHEAPTWPPPH
jgi:hypothetical protein